MSEVVDWRTGSLFPKNYCFGWLGGWRERVREGSKESTRGALVFYCAFYRDLSMRAAISAWIASILLLSAFLMLSETASSRYPNWSVSTCSQLLVVTARVTDKIWCITVKMMTRPNHYHATTQNLQLTSSKYSLKTVCCADELVASMAATLAATRASLTPCDTENRPTGEYTWWMLRTGWAEPEAAAKIESSLAPPLACDRHSYRSQQFLPGKMH
jgi:hypothetical protein